MAGQIYLGEAFKVEQSIELLLDKIFVSLHDDNDEGGQNRFHGLDKAEEEALMRWRSPFCRHLNSPRSSDDGFGKRTSHKIKTFGSFG